MMTTNKQKKMIEHFDTSPGSLSGFLSSSSSLMCSCIVFILILKGLLK
jgi:hypothetical protein